MTQHRSGTAQSRAKSPYLATGPNGPNINSYLDMKKQPEVKLGDEGEWVDYEQDRESQRVYTRSSSTGSSYRASPRKRGTRRVVQLSTSPRKQGSIPPSPKPSSRSGAQEQTEEIRDVVLGAVTEGAKSSGLYIFDIFKTVARLSRWPIAFCMTSFILMILMGQISRSLRRAFEPLCIIPGISSLAACNLGPREPPSSVKNFAPIRADYSTLMQVQSKSFEELLGEVAGGSALSLEIKHAEMATKDLITRVRISDLKAKDTLATSLSEFVEDAKDTGRSLQRLTSKIGGAVDNIMAVNDYALQSIASERAKVASPWSLKGMVSWNPHGKVDEIVRQTFEEATSVLSANMERLVVEAEHNLHNLNNLEERLSTLHELVSREDSSISSARDDLLADLWTKLGGNKKYLRNFEHHRALLKGLGSYRQQALVHVVATLQTLRAMGSDMEDMRERVAAPDLMGTTVPVEVHMKSIQMGLERLREGRMRAKKLEEDAINKVLSIGDGALDA